MKVRKPVPKEFLEIKKILLDSFQSEDPLSYADSDGEGWGPSMGLAANRAAQRNQDIRRLVDWIKSYSKELRSSKPKTSSRKAAR